MTERLESGLALRLSPGAGSGVYRLYTRIGAATLARGTEAAGWHFLLADASKVRDKAGFLSVAGTSLDFPAWAGHHWDAFEELVNDLSWLPPARGYVLLLDNLGEFGRQRPEDLRVGLEILEAAAANRDAAGQPPLLVLVRGAGRPGHHLPYLTVD